jgi:PBP1b-binding outer membrane lipoprotein LpoB
MTKSRIVLLLSALAVVGCLAAVLVAQPQSAAKVKPAAAATAEPEKPEPVKLGKETVPSVARTPDMPAYHWPADFNPPLVINIETEEVPKEILGPSPPVKEDAPAKDEKK